MMMLKFKNRSISNLPAGLLLVAIGLIGCSVILIELVSYYNSISETKRSFSQSQTQQLDLLKTELDNKINHLVHIFPAFSKSQEFLEKIEGATLCGPYFVYAPQQYGQPIDYWDQVQLVRRQIWMTNYFLPLIQSKQLDHIGVHLIDPHNNLIKNSSIPFLEIQSDDISFYSYPIKGLFHQFSKQSIYDIKNLQLSDEYFDQIIYDTSGRKTLYSVLGFNETNLLLGKSKKEDENDSDNINVTLDQNQIIFRKSITLSSSIYNWRSRKRENTAVARIVAQKQLTDKFLLSIKERFGSNNLAIVYENRMVLSTGMKKQFPSNPSEGEIKLGKEIFIFKLNPYANPLLEKTLNLVVLTGKKELELNPFSFYRSLVVPAGVTILLLTMIYFFIKSRPIEKFSLGISQSNIQIEQTAETIELEVTIPDTDHFFLVEEDGNTTTIPFDRISHIRVTDHYCTIFYKQNNNWKNWMIIERLKTFEKRYDGLLVRLNRSTLINPDHIDKVQLIQRKLTMAGEPGNLLTIRQASLIQIKNIIKNKNLDPSSPKKYNRNGF